ncbi:MAG: M1 family metallopeptidase [Phycisphaerales bacterium]|nr:M1 family metallopeptidase [Phycisphaerales bacterium]
MCASRLIVRCLSVLLLVVSPVFVFGCSSTQSTGGGGDRPGIGQSESVGAADEQFRRSGGSDGQNIFRQIGWATPSEMRLGSGQPGPDYWQQQCDYEIQATLEPESGVISASMRVTYTNNSPHTLRYIWMNLEQNLFRGESIGTNSRTPGSVMKMLEYDFGGGYTVSRLQQNGRDLEMKVYDTLGRFDLPTPLASGQRLVFEMDYSFPVPPHLRRMGSEVVEQGKIFELAQWIPQVCKYDDVHGWNTLPYLGSGEFYTDFGSYEVAITVPREYIVAASGMLQNPGEVLTGVQQARLERAMGSDEPVWIIEPSETATDFARPSGDGPMTWRFRIDNARTFAWAASQAFQWDACSAEIADGRGGTRRVLCQSLFPKEAEVWSHEHEDGGSSRYVKHSIEFYSDFLFPYPYLSMSNINGPEGGMEYPGIVFCGARTNPRGLFGVTDHEVGHNWFPMVINSDERRYMWQDEGFNTFINMYSKADWYDENVDIRRAAQQTMELCSAPNCQPIMTQPDRAWPRWVGSLMYRKTGYGLWLMREYILGNERFDDAFQGYMQGWYMKHPQPDDFFRAMEDGAGADLNWFWRGWFLEPYALDQAIAGVKNTSDGAIVVLDNLGDMVMPVRMLVEYKDGSSEIVDLPVEIWHQTSRWRAGLKTHGRTVKSVTLDPEGILPDLDRANNSWR